MSGPCHERSVIALTLHRAPYSGFRSAIMSLTRIIMHGQCQESRCHMGNSRKFVVPFASHLCGR